VAAVPRTAAATRAARRRTPAAGGRPPRSPAGVRGAAVSRRCAGTRHECEILTLPRGQRIRMQRPAVARAAGRHLAAHHPRAHPSHPTRGRSHRASQLVGAARGRGGRREAPLEPRALGLPRRLARGDTVILTENDSNNSKRLVCKSRRNVSQRQCRMTVLAWANATSTVLVVAPGLTREVARRGLGGRRLARGKLASFGSAPGQSDWPAALRRNGDGGAPPAAAAACKTARPL
jgi:hypothetical protein